MFPGHFKISGHSGTSQKNKKAFSKQKEYYRKKLDNKSRIQNVERISPRNHYRPVNKDDKVLKFIKYIGITITLVALVWISYLIINELIIAYNISTQKYIENQRKIVTREDNEAYKVLIQSGAEYFNENQLDLAQEEFLLALKVRKNGMDAKIGLTKVLGAKCKQFNQYCEEYNKNIKHLKKTNQLTSEQLNEIDEKN